MKTIREQLKDKIKGIDESIIQDWWVKSHTSCTEQWVEVYPDGRWYATEEPSSSTSHYIEYPDKPVASIYAIATNSSQYCDCWVCTLMRDFEDSEMSDEEFEKEYGYTRVEIDCKSWKELVTEYNHNNDVYESDVIDEMLCAIDNIEYGYFDDEF